MLVIVDRDGVINVDRRDYVKTPGELVMLPGSADAIARLNQAGHRVAICTNQACVGRGIVSLDAIERVHEHLHHELAKAGAHVDAVFIAPDKPRPDRSWLASDRRKPGSGMVREALAKFDCAPDQAIFIGDTLTDMQAAAGAGVARALVRTGHGLESLATGIDPALAPVEIFDDLAAAVSWLLARGRMLP